MPTVRSARRDQIDVPAEVRVAFGRFGPRLTAAQLGRLLGVKLGRVQRALRIGPYVKCKVGWELRPEE